MKYSFEEKTNASTTTHPPMQEAVTDARSSRAPNACCSPWLACKREGAYKRAAYRAAEEMRWLGSLAHGCLLPHGTANLALCPAPFSASRYTNLQYQRRDVHRDTLLLRGITNLQQHRICHKTKNDVLHATDQSRRNYVNTSIPEGQLNYMRVGPLW